MQPTQSEVDSMVHTLNNLIETSIDGENGFKAAAKDCTDASLKHVFMQHSRECRDFSTELQRLVVTQAVKPDAAGSLSAVIHRGWMNLKASVTTRDNLAVLEECERGEDYALKQFQEAALSEHLGMAATLVKKQCGMKLKSYNQIKDLRDKLKAKTTPN